MVHKITANISILTAMHPEGRGSSIMHNIAANICILMVMHPEGRDSTHYGCLQKCSKFTKLDKVLNVVAALNEGCDPMHRQTALTS